MPSKCIGSRSNLDRALCWWRWRRHRASVLAGNSRRPTAWIRHLCYRPCCQQWRWRRWRRRRRRWWCCSGVAVGHARAKRRDVAAADGELTMVTSVRRRGVSRARRPRYSWYTAVSVRSSRAFVRYDSAPAGNWWSLRVSAADDGSAAAATIKRRQRQRRWRRQ